MKSNFLKEPLFHFLFFGALIFLFARITADSNPEHTLEDDIYVSASSLTTIHKNWQVQYGRLPTQHEMKMLVAEHIRSEAQYLAAIELGLDLNDVIVRRRMIQKYQFLYGRDADFSSPDNKILAEYYRSNQTAYQSEGRFSFNQVYFDPDMQGNSAEARAKAALADLNVGSLVSGDRLPIPAQFEKVSYSNISRQFGIKFLQSLKTLPQGKWVGPVTSGYGFHVVKVIDHKLAMIPQLALVRERVIANWRADENKKLLDQRINDLIKQNNFQIDYDALKALPLMRVRGNNGQ